MYMKSKNVEIYVELLEEGTPTLRRTQAISLGDNIFQLLPDDNYDPEDEIWQFLPNTYVTGEMRQNGDKLILVAVKQADFK